MRAALLAEAISADLEATVGQETRWKGLRHTSIVPILTPYDTAKTQTGHQGC